MGQLGNISLSGVSTSIYILSRGNEVPACVQLVMSNRIKFRCSFYKPDQKCINTFLSLCKHKAIGRVHNSLVRWGKIEPMNVYPLHLEFWCRSNNQPLGCLTEVVRSRTIVVWPPSLPNTGHVPLRTSFPLVSVNNKLVCTKWLGWKRMKEKIRRVRTFLKSRSGVHEFL